MKLPVSVIVLTYNEEKNIGSCLESVKDWADEIFVVDSGSVDKTLQVAGRYTDKICGHRFDNYASQRNWAQDNLPIRNRWVFHLDADESVSPGLFSELVEIFSGDTVFDGFMMPRKTVFRGRWIRHGGHYPSYHLRLFRKEKGRCEERYYDQHYIVEGRTAILKSDIINTISPDIKRLIDKFKVELGAREILSGDKAAGAGFFGSPIDRIKWLRYNIYYRSPIFLRPLLYFMYRYFLRLGFLDGAGGLIFHFYQGFWFRLLVDAKSLKLRYSK